MSTPTPNMGLILPVETVTPGPEWATELNTALTTVDNHDHTEGKGAPIPFSAITVTGDQDYNGFSPTDVKAVAFSPQSAVLDNTNSHKVYDVNGDLYWNNNAGTPVQITQGNIITPPTVVGIPTAVIFPFAGASAPSGYLLCNGAAVSRTTYSLLFAIVGTTYGVGDGSTTYNVPNLQGRAPIGIGTYTDPVSGGITRTLGQVIGAEAHILTTPQLASHTHLQDPHIHELEDGLIANPGGSRDYLTITGVGNVSESGPANYHGIPVAPTTATNQNTGGDTSHNNMQPSLAVTYIIKF